MTETWKFSQQLTFRRQVGVPRTLSKTMYPPTGPPETPAAASRRKREEGPSGCGQGLQGSTRGERDPSAGSGVLQLEGHGALQTDSCVLGYTPEPPAARRRAKRRGTQFSELTRERMGHSGWTVTSRFGQARCITSVGERSRCCRTRLAGGVGVHVVFSFCVYISLTSS